MVEATYIVILTKKIFLSGRVTSTILLLAVNLPSSALCEQPLTIFESPSTLDHHHCLPHPCTTTNNNRQSINPNCLIVIKYYLVNKKRWVTRNIIRLFLRCHFMCCDSKQSTIINQWPMNTLPYQSRGARAVLLEEIKVSFWLSVQTAPALNKKSTTST